jgi:MGT family glycosyltransferase
MKDEAIPPTFSGYPGADPADWGAFRKEYDRVHRDLWSSFDQWCRQQGAPPLDDLDFIHVSPVMNLYLFPEIADYARRVPLDQTWHRLGSSVRATEEPFEVPESLKDGPGSLIYLSLGSLGSADVELMQRLVESLAKTPHRYIVSKGPRAEMFELADNMWGDARLPQTSIIPQVDLVITHGGNNTTTESFHFGKPMIVLPLFWDQYDNAQRVDEAGFGARLDTYRFTDGQMHGAIDRLLGDQALRERMAEAGESIRAERGTERAADLIENLAGS